MNHHALFPEGHALLTQRPLVPVQLLLTIFKRIHQVFESTFFNAYRSLPIFPVISTRLP